jgi:hypothetical protein
MQQELNLFHNCSIEQVDDQTLLISPMGGADMKSAVAQGLLYSISSIRAELEIRGLKKALIARGEGKPPYPILRPTFPAFSEESLRAIGRSNPTLARAMDPIAELAEGEKFITIVSMESGRCKHSNVTKERGIRPAPEWTGYDYRQSWRIDGENLSEEYFKLVNRLYDNEQLTGFEYKLIRPDDGALVSYATDFFYLPDWYGEPVRVGLSNPNDYQVLEAGRGDRIIR